MNHTGFVVSDMERSVSFYRDLLGFHEDRNDIMEGEFISQGLGFDATKIHIVYLGIGDMRHSVELVQYLNPVGNQAGASARNDVGTSHLGIIVDDLDALYADLSSKGVRFVNPPASRPGVPYPMARKLCFAMDPDGNILEFIEREPTPPGATVV